MDVNANITINYDFHGTLPVLFQILCCEWSNKEISNAVDGGKKMSSKISLPKPELIEGDINFPEMIKQDFRKAILIISLSMISGILVTGALFALAYFI